MALSYLIFGVLLGIGWNKALKVSVFRDEKEAGSEVSIIVPMRNEQANIASLLSALYGSLDRSELLFELIIVDDHSSDDSVKIVKDLLAEHKGAKCIESDGTGKIDAIKTGLGIARNDRIISLDADVVVTDDWADAICRLLNTSDQADMIILPVVGIASDTLSSKFAALDFIALIGVTFAMAGLGRPIMANAAHLSYRKQCADWSPSVVSGDDVFLLHRIKEKKGTVSCRLDKDLIVRTEMPKTWRDVVQQRLRWASKTSDYKDWDTLLLGWYILILNVVLWVLFCLTFFQDGFLPVFLTLLITKMAVDLIFLFMIGKWFGKLDYLKQFPMVWILNSFMYPVVFILSRSKGFEWKGRVYR